MKILLVKMSSLGDVICNLPLVSDIRTHYPDAQIDWVVEERITDIPGWHKGVSNILPIGLRRWRKSLTRVATWKEIAEFRKKLKANRYDYVLDTQGLMKSVLVSRQAIGIAHGPDKRSAREPFAARFYHHVYPIPRGQHAVRRNRLLGSLALGYEVDFDRPDFGIVAPDSGTSFDWLPTRAVLCFHGTARAAKKWSSGSWARFANQLIAKGLNPVFAWGSQQEREEAVTIVDQVAGGIVAPEPRLNVAASAELIARASLVVGVDTGFVHLAAALNKPTIGIFVDSDPQRNGAQAGLTGVVRNLGNIGRPPSVEEVLQSSLSIVR